MDLNSHPHVELNWNISPQPTKHSLTHSCFSICIEQLYTEGDSEQLTPGFTQAGTQPQDIKENQDHPPH